MSKVSVEDRLLEYKELVAAKAELAADDLVMKLRDGRAIVRANAALGLAALGHTGPELVPFLRDGDPVVALAAAEALAHLGAAQRPHLTAIAAALDGARPEVAETVERMFSELVGKADAALIAVMDTGEEVVAAAIVHACERISVRGLHLLQAATHDERTRVRINAVRGISLLGEIEHDTSMEILLGVARDDLVSDVRAAARTAVFTLTARTQANVRMVRRRTEPAPAAVPELELREMAPDELAAAAKIAPLDELLRGIADPRVHARLNSVRIIALQGAPAAASARAVAVLVKDPESKVRVEAARALGKLGVGAIIAPALVRALGDQDPAVVSAAEASLADLGDAAAPALVDGLDVPSEAHGARVAALLGRLGDGVNRLRDALASPAVDVRVHAALGLGALGKSRAAGAVPALAAAVGGNARVRIAVARALATLDPRPERAAPAIAVAGFGERVLTDDELGKAKAAFSAAGVGGLAAHLGDARAAVRANAAAGLGALGADSLAAMDALAACLRDDDADVRLAAARALDRVGDAAVAACAPDLVRALRDADDRLAAQLATMLGRAASVDGALGRALDGADGPHARRILDIVCTRPSALDVLADAFLRPSAAGNAARGFIQLGKDRLGKARALLERARVDTSNAVRELAQATLRAIDGPPADAGLPKIAGFETDLLEAKAFTGKLDAAQFLTCLQDGRAVVRANAATALGTLGNPALAISLGPLLRDDEPRVRVATARALDQLGDDAVVAAAAHLVGALRGDANVADVCKAALAPREGKVEAALVAGLETGDEAHGMRIAELICALPNAREILFAAFDGEAQNVQINAALGIGMLGVKNAGPEGRRRLVAGCAGPHTRRRTAMVKALAMFEPAR
jgi:HEAT repeat protein